MSDEPASFDNEQRSNTSDLNRRMMIFLAVYGLVAGLIFSLAVSARFGLSVFLGAAICFGNVVWLRSSLAGLFESINSESGGSRSLMVRSVLRYAVMIALIGGLLLSGSIDAVGLAVGIAGIAFAALFETFYIIFNSTFNNRES